MSAKWPKLLFGEFLKPNSRPYTLGSEEDANLVGMRWYGDGPFHRELKPAVRIAKKSHYIIKAGDVIYNKLFAWKGSFGIVGSDLDGMFVSDKFPTYELDCSKVDQGYLKWFFRYPPLWEQAREMSTGSAALSKLTLNPSKFLLLNMPVPPQDEQKRIATRIEALAGHIGEARVLHRQTSEEIEALLFAAASAVFGHMSAKATLSSVLIDKPRNGWSAKCDNLVSGVFVLMLSAVTGFQYNSSAFKRTSELVAPDAHYWLSRGDLLMTRSNTPELVGHVAIYDGIPTPCIYPDLIMKLNVDKKVADPRFVWLWLQTGLVREFVKKHAKGTSPTMKKISQSVVMAIPFPDGIPLSEQCRIVAEFDRVQTEVNRLRQVHDEATAQLNALLPSIIERAFKGGL
jgi:type I restriction enzyme S subunit